MAYPAISSTKGIAEFLQRKELAQLKAQPTKTTALDLEIQRDGKLQLQTYQKFPSIWLNPNNLNQRLLVKFDTGTGKTVSVIEAALNFIKQFMDNYRISERIERSPEIFIIGFSRQIFIREFMKRPEFGFVTRDEIIKESRLRASIANGSSIDRDELARFHSEIKKRFTKKYLGGFIRFYGYKEFFNRLFIFTDVGLKSLADKLGFDILDRSSMTEEQILIGLEAGFIKLNLDLIDALVNAFMIFDEFHNVYNSSDINNYGIAIKIVLLIHDRPDLMKRYGIAEPKLMERLHSSLIRAIFMTATPLNNSPTEIIDLLNMLIGVDKIQKFYQREKKPDWSTRLRLEKRDFFLDNRNLIPGALESIRELIRGHVSYLSDTNPAYFPTYEFTGELLPIPTSLTSHRSKGYRGKEVPYLKFKRCVMSPFQMRTYKSLTSVGTLPPDGQSLLDIALPNPNSKEIGLFRTREIKHALRHASAKWCAKNGINLERRIIGNNIPTDVIVGSFMRLRNIKTFSTKFARLLEDLISNLTIDGGKGIINHQLVRMSGVLFIEEMLRVNGFLDEYSEPTDLTRCSKCGVVKQTHNKNNGHDFMPARFIVLHSDIDPAVRDRSVEKFKAADNIDGYKYRFVLGSKLINESMDFSEVQNIYLVTVPANISTLIQIIGRAIRKGSHRRLALNKRHVSIHIYTSSLGRSNDLSYEERKYFEKSMDYLVIQQLELLFNSEAIDKALNHDIIFPPGIKSDQKLGRLPFEIVRPDKSAVNTDTFDVWFKQSEIDTIIYCCKRLFIEQSPCWTYFDLLAAVRDPPFSIQQDPTMFAEDSFAIALDLLINGIGMPGDQVHWIDKLFDPVQYQITIDNVNYRIVQVNDFIMRVPLIPIVGEVSLIGTSVIDLNGVPDIDIDSVYRKQNLVGQTILDITKQLQTTSASYDSLKQKFFKKFNRALISNFPIGIEVYGIDFHIRLAQDAIRYCFNIMVDPDMKFSEMHTFYFKLLWFYDKFDLILYAQDLQGTNLFESYTKYTTRSDIKYGLHQAKPESKSILRIKDFVGKHHLNEFLIMSLMKTAGLNKPFDLSRLNEFLGRTKTASALTPRRDFLGDLGKWVEPSRKRITKVFANLLPVGHFLNAQNYTQTVSIPILYAPDWKSTKEVKEWSPANDFASIIKDNVNDVENDIIVGYYDKTQSSVELKFKLRQPIHKMTQYEDSRMMERGSACSTRKKEELHSIMKTLDIKLDKRHDNIRSMCDIIKLELMRREILSRKNSRGTRIRWFYFHFENQPFNKI